MTGGIRAPFKRKWRPSYRLQVLVIVHFVGPSSKLFPIRLRPQGERLEPWLLEFAAKPPRD
eukprot:1297375-Pyramimonas_sp.AAC.1